MVGSYVFITWFQVSMFRMVSGQWSVRRSIHVVPCIVVGRGHRWFIMSSHSQSVFRVSGFGCGSYEVIGIPRMCNSVCQAQTLCRRFPGSNNTKTCIRAFRFNRSIDMCMRLVVSTIIDYGTLCMFCIVIAVITLQRTEDVRSVSSEYVMSSS